MRKFGFNVLAVFVGLAGGAIGYWIGKLFLVDFLGSIPFIPNLLMDYEWLVFIGVLASSLWAGFWPCSKLCNLAKTKYNYGLVVFGVLNVVNCIITMVTYFSVEGFSLHMLYLYLITIAGYLYFTISGIRGDID